MRDIFDAHLRPLGLGLIFALLAGLFNIGVGVAFGAFEQKMKDGLEESGRAVLVEKYGGDEAKMKAVTAKSLVYYQRAHLHGGGTGATALACILLLAFAGGPRRLAQVTAFGLGFGALGYSVSWLIAGRLAPGLGGTGAAKDAIEWLALPSVGLYAVGTGVTILIVGLRLLRRASPPAAEADDRLAAGPA